MSRVQTVLLVMAALVCPSMSSAQLSGTGAGLEVGADLSGSPDGYGGWWSLSPRIAIRAGSRTTVEVSFAPELSRAGVSHVDYLLAHMRRTVHQFDTGRVVASAGLAQYHSVFYSPYRVGSSRDTNWGPTMGIGTEIDLATYLRLRLDVQYVITDRQLLRFGGGLTVPIGRAVSAARDDAPSGWPRLRRGQTVWVTDEAGIRTKGDLTSLSATELTVTRRGGGRTLATANVRRIEVPDRVVDGLAAGGITGGVAGGVLGALLFHSLCEQDGPCAALGAMIFGGLGGGMGALTGVLVDSFHDGRRTVYDAAERPTRAVVAV
ncbi:MAG: hypothetical protein ABI051_07830 [Vicinamibacterales bacterium]